MCYILIFTINNSCIYQRLEIKKEYNNLKKKYVNMLCTLYNMYP